MWRCRNTSDVWPTPCNCARDKPEFPDSEFKVQHSPGYTGRGQGFDRHAKVIKEPAKPDDDPCKAQSEAWQRRMTRSRRLMRSSSIISCSRMRRSRPVANDGVVQGCREFNSGGLSMCARNHAAHQRWHTCLLRWSLLIAAWFALGLAAPAPASADDASESVQLWSARLVDDVDWLVAVWDWPAADQASGRMLSLLVPLQDEVGQASGNGPVLIAGKTLVDGSRRRILLLPREQVAPERLKSARPFPPVAGPSTRPSLYLIGDLAAIGSAELLKPAMQAGAAMHPLSELLRRSTPRTVGAFAFRPNRSQRRSVRWHFLAIATAARSHWIPAARH